MGATTGRSDGGLQDGRSRPIRVFANQASANSETSHRPGSSDEGGDARLDRAGRTAVRSRRARAPARIVPPEP
jgi:hypothetical protein